MTIGSTCLYSMCSLALSHESSMALHGKMLIRGFSDAATHLARNCRSFDLISSREDAPRVSTF